MSRLYGIFMWGSRDYKNGVGEMLLCKRGSILILVLWVLALLGFLAGEYLSHNRGKAVLSSGTWNSEKESQAIDSVIQLFSTDIPPVLGEETTNDWFNLAPGGIHLWVKSESEKEKTNINSAPEANIRADVRKALGDGNVEKADQITDAILDWRDTDDLVRLNGAESEYYAGQNLPYHPADGPIKSLTELLLVKGMTAELFWGDPLSTVMESVDDKKEEEPPTQPLVQTLTIYEGDVKRLSIVVPVKGRSYIFVLALLKKENGKWHTLQVYRAMLLNSGKEDQSENG